MRLTTEQTARLFLLTDVLQAYLQLASSDGRSERQPLRMKLKVILPVVRRMLVDTETEQKAISNLENEGGITL